MGKILTKTYTRENVRNGGQVKKSGGNKRDDWGIVLYKSSKEKKKAALANPSLVGDFLSFCLSAQAVAVNSQNVGLNWVTAPI